MNNQEKPLSYINNSTRVYTTILGLFVGISGIVHGLYEVFQGNKATEGFYLPSIGAVTLIPNYLFTGIAAIVVGIFILIWSIGFIQTKSGPGIFLFSSILLFFVGGGVAHILIFLIAWLVSTNIRSSLSFWERIISKHLRGTFSKIWLPVLVAGLLFVLSGVLIWIFIIPPGEIREITSTHYLLWSLLLVGVFLLIVDIILGFSRDIEKRGK